MVFVRFCGGGKSNFWGSVTLFDPVAMSWSRHPKIYLRGILYFRASHDITKLTYRLNDDLV